jgi:hypothetical protein
MVKIEVYNYVILDLVKQMKGIENFFNFFFFFFFLTLKFIYFFLKKENPRVADLGVVTPPLERLGHPR